MTDRWPTRIAIFLIGGLIFGVLGYVLGSAGVDVDAGLGERPIVATSDSALEAERVTASRSAQEPVPATAGAPSAEDRLWMDAAVQRERERRAAATIDDEDTGLDVLRKILEHDADVDALFADFETFSRPLRVRADDEVVVRLTPETAEEVLTSYRGKASRVVFDLAPGRYVNVGLDLRGAEHVTFRGAGMDVTQLSLSGTFLHTMNTDNVTLQDMTFTDCASSIVRGAARVAMLLERVRLRTSDGFLNASGYGYVAARDCFFEGGHGTKPMSSAIFVHHARSFGYFRDCVFREMYRPVSAYSDGCNGSVFKLEGCSCLFSGRTEESTGEITVLYSGNRFEGYETDAHPSPARVVDLGGNVSVEHPRDATPLLGDVLRRCEGPAVVAARYETWTWHLRFHALVTDVQGNVRRYFIHPVEGPQLRTESRGRPSATPLPRVSALDALATVEAIPATEDELRSGADPVTFTAKSVELVTPKKDGPVSWKVTRWDAREFRVDADTGQHVPR